MNEAIDIKTDEDVEDIQDKILKAIQARKMKENASHFAFTATPKNSTLERFGISKEDGSFVLFHLYSMKQAIEEGFILDVLANYTTYKSYYEIENPRNPNPRGAHGSEKEKDLLDEIIKQFNERWFQGWNETPEEQRARLILLTQSVQTHPDFKQKVLNNTDKQNSEIAYKKIVDHVMEKQRVNGLELYKLYRTDETFKQFIIDSTKRLSLSIT